MLNNPLIFGLVCALVITLVYTLIMVKMKKKEKNKYNKNDSIILFTISLIITALIQLFVSSNYEDTINQVMESTTDNISSKMLTGTPNF
jgi:hypothetical protein